MDLILKNLIELVQQYPQLWNRKEPNFKDKTSVEYAWKSISLILDCSVEECQQAWSYIRTRFTKERKIIKELPPDSASRESKWPYYRLCSFLEGVIQTRRSKGNILKTKTTPSAESPLAIKEEEEWAELQTSTDSSLQGQQCTESEFSGCETVLSPEIAIEIPSTPSTSRQGHFGEYIKIVSPSRLIGQQRGIKRKSDDIHSEALGQPCSELEQELSSTTGHSSEGISEDYYFALSLGKHLEKIKSRKKKIQLKAKIMALLAEYESDDE